MNDFVPVPRTDIGPSDDRAPYAAPRLESATQTLTTLLASGAGEGCDPSADPEPTPAG